MAKNNTSASAGNLRNQLEPEEHTVSSHTMSWNVNRLPAWAWTQEKLSRQFSNVRASTVLIISIALSAIIGFSAGWIGATYGRGGTVLNGSTSAQKQIVTSESQLINNIAQTVGPSVVSVNVTATSQNDTNFLGFGLPQSEESAGTGIILTAGGLIMTNRHVVPAGTTKVSVTLADGTELKDVSVLGRTSASSSLDVAFLKINNTDGKKLTPAILGDSSKVQVGDAVVAIGNALGQFQNTVTSGIISGYGRSVQAGSADGSQATESLDDLFQTDAAINEGNSGGPLVNLNGQVVGLNTAIAGNAQNIGFAIPINDIKGLITQVEASGKLQQPWLGLYYIPITNDVAQQYALSVNRGAWVPPVGVLGQDPIVANGPADKAGVRAGDIITAVDGVMINQNSSLTSLISRDTVGQTVSLRIVRGSTTLTLRAQLSVAPSDDTTDATTQSYQSIF